MAKGIGKERWQAFEFYFKYRLGHDHKPIFHVSDAILLTLTNLFAKNVNLFTKACYLIPCYPHFVPIFEGHGVPAINAARTISVLNFHHKF